MGIKILALFTVMVLALYGGEIDTRLEINDIQEILELKSTLNGGGFVTDYEDGYNGNLEVLGDAKYKEEMFSITFSDKITIGKVKEGRIQNKVAEAYVTAHIGNLFIDFGKKKNGRSGVFIKPLMDFETSLSNISKSAEERKKFSEGLVQINADLFTDYGIISASYIPEITTGGDIEKYISSSQSENKTVCYSVSLDSLDIKSVALLNENYKAGGSISFSMFDNSIIIYSEGIYEKNVKSLLIKKSVADINGELTSFYENENHNIDNVFSFAAGGEISTGDVGIRGEYLYNGAGLGKNEIGNMQNEMKEAAVYKEKYKADAIKSNIARGKLGAFMEYFKKAGSLNYARNYLLGRAAYNGLSRDKVEITATTIADIDDFSGIGIIGISYGGINNANISLQYSKSYGGEYGEYMVSGFDNSIKGTFSFYM